MKYRYSPHFTNEETKSLRSNLPKIIKAKWETQDLIPYLPDSTVFLNPYIRLQIQCV